MAAIQGTAFRHTDKHSQFAGIQEVHVARISKFFSKKYILTLLFQNFGVKLGVTDFVPHGNFDRFRPTQISSHF